MNLAEVKNEIHFLVRLPQHVKHLKEKIAFLYEDIGPPVYRVSEDGFLGAFGLSSHAQALYIADARSAIEKRIDRDISRGKRLVEAINSLCEEERRQLVDHFTKKADKDIQPVLDKLSDAITTRMVEKKGVKVD